MGLLTIAISGPEALIGDVSPAVDMWVTWAGNDDAQWMHVGTFVGKWWSMVEQQQTQDNGRKLVTYTLIN